MRSDTFSVLSPDLSPDLLTIALKTKDIESPESFRNSKKTVQNTPSTMVSAIDCEFVLQNETDEPFQAPFYRMHLKIVLIETLKYFKNGLAMAINHCSNTIVIFVSFYYIGSLKNHRIESSFGQGIAYWNFAFASLNSAAFEVTGIQTSKYFGQKNYKMMSVSLVQGQIMQSYLLLFGIFQFGFSEQILTGLGIARSNAVLTSHMVRWLIPSTIMQGINFQLMAFCNSQGISLTFGLSNLTSTLVSSFCCYWLFYDMNCGILLFSQCKIIMESINMIFIMYTLAFRIQKGTLNFVRIKDIKKGFWEFMYYGMKISISLFVMYLGFEFNNYLTGMMEHQMQISAWVSWLNITGILYSIGQGFSNATRTNVGNYIGEGKFIQAKNYSNFSIFITSVFGLFISLLLLKNIPFVASLYSPLEEIQSWLRSILYIYIVGAACEIIIGNFNTLMRLTGKAHLDVIIMVLGYCTFGPIMSWYFGFYLKMGIEGLMLSFVLNVSGCIIAFFILIQKTNWDNLKIHSM